MIAKQAGVPLARVATRDTFGAARGCKAVRHRECHRDTQRLACARPATLLLLRPPARGRAAHHHSVKQRKEIQKLRSARQRLPRLSDSRLGVCCAGSMRSRLSACVVRMVAAPRPPPPQLSERHTPERFVPSRNRPRCAVCTARHPQRRTRHPQRRTPRQVEQESSRRQTLVRLFTQAPHRTGAAQSGVRGRPALLSNLPVLPQ